MTYLPAPNRYETMKYNRCGRSGVKLPLSRGYKDRLQERMGRTM